MKIKTAEFISSIADMKKSPQTGLPEFAFIGRSNVGKSSLVNMLTGFGKLAKTSGKPGKTQTINHFLINKEWYIVDLPGYGYASVSKDIRKGFGKIIDGYIHHCKTLFCLFILIDVRLKPQKIDVDFINWAGQKGIPISLIFTKADKVSKSQANQNIKVFGNALSTTWSELPPIIISSSVKKTGRNELLEFIENALGS